MNEGIKVTCLMRNSENTVVTGEKMTGGSRCLGSDGHCGHELVSCLPPCRSPEHGHLKSFTIQRWRVRTFFVFV